MKRSTRYSPKLKWMEPYLELGMTFISEGNFVERIGAWTMGGSRGLDVFAALYQDRLGGPYRMWFHTHYDNGEGQKPFSRIDLLKHLAHEIAHIEEPSFKHTPRHEKICSQITIAFMKMLHSEGYESEEAELKAGFHE
jgi:hypothetical protein